MAIKIDMRPTAKELSKRQKLMLAALSGSAASFKKVSVLLDRWVQKNFRTQGGNVGRWEPFAVRRDGNRGRWIKGKGLDTSAKLLQDTGNLRASFKPFFSKDNAGIGSRVDYAEFHEFGIGHLPMRRMLPYRREVFKEVKKIIDRHISDSLKKLKGR